MSPRSHLVRSRNNAPAVRAIQNHTKAITTAVIARNRRRMPSTRKPEMAREAVWAN